MPKIIDHAKRKQEIAIAACTAISELGIETVKLTDIGKQAGCTTGAITHYFANKNEVLIAAWEYAYNDFIRHMDRISAIEPYCLMDVLSEALPTTPRALILTNVWMALNIRSLRILPLTEKQVETSRDWTARIRNELEKAKTLGDVSRHIDLDIEAQTISVVLNGLSLRAITNPTEWPRSRQIEILHHYVDRLAPKSK
jgi:TetR/AcrR family transcriptional regulator, transcriptional repressor of bet genes